MPAKLNLKSYTDNKFPVWIGDKDQEFIYWHILKNRDNPPDFIVPMLNNLKFFDFEEVQTLDFEKYIEDFNKKGHCDKIKIN